MDVGPKGWVSIPLHPAIVPGYTVHERAVVFHVNFLLSKPHRHERLAFISLSLFPFTPHLLPPPIAPQHRPAKKKIRCTADVEAWQNSTTFANLITFLTGLNDSVKGKSLTQGRAEASGGAAVQALLAVLAELRSWIAEIPLEDLHSQRYGNKAFRTWHTRVAEKAATHMTSVLSAGGASTEKSEEIAVYWKDAFGNDTRIDYGTGHELNFAVTLYCFTKLDCFPQSDMSALVTTVFAEYIALMRQMQGHYLMEPAGSKGVWGLDDYHHLPLYWGASQLIDNQEVSPATAEKLCHENAKEYLYLDCISWILKNKTGQFHENSPTLSSLSSLQWTKINKGMMKMYIGEVLGQWPVVQHLCFGTLFPYE